MCIKTFVTDNKVISLHSGVAVKYTSEESLRTQDGRSMFVQRSFSPPCQESTLSDDGYRKTAETSVMEVSAVAAELLDRPKCAKRLRKLQILEGRPIRGRRKLHF